MGLGASSFRGMSVDEGIQLMAAHLAERNMTVEDAFKWMDRDHNQYVTWEEFYQGVQHCVAHVCGQTADPDALGHIFLKFDTNKDGYMSLAELQYTIDRACNAERLANDVLERVASSLVRLGKTPTELFQRLDQDRNGVLQRHELEQVICSLQPDLTVREREAIWNNLDADRSGYIDINEFHRRVQAVNAGPLVALEEKIGTLQRQFTANGYGTYEMFRAYDTNGDSHLGIEEWRQAMAALAPTMAPQDVDAIFARFDQNDDGFLSLQEFSVFYQDAIDRRPPLPIGADGWPVYTAPPQEAQWETELLNTMRDCFSIGRSGFTPTEVFRRLDLDGNQSMTREEFDRMCLTYNMNLREEHLASLFAKVNVSGSGSISISEFVRRFG